MSCHNRNPSAEANGSGLWLRLALTDVQGGRIADTDAVTSTVGVEAKAETWSGRMRIEPGSATTSLLLELAGMHPYVPMNADSAAPAIVEAWINAMR